MLDLLAEWILSITTAIPAVFVAENSTNFLLFRVLFALLLLTLIVYLIAMRPFRSWITGCVQRLSRPFKGGG